MAESGTRPRDLIRGPCQRGRRVDVDHDVQVVAHHGVGVHADGEHPGEFDQPVLDPLLAVLEAAAAQCVLTAEECAAHAARDAVVEARRFGVDRKRPVTTPCRATPRESGCRLTLRPASTCAAAAPRYRGPWSSAAA
jgi:hypothetical protein